MAFEHRLSKVVSITKDKDASGKERIVMDFRYVRYELVLDDEARKSELIELLTGERLKKEKKDVKIPLPKFYGEGR